MVISFRKDGGHIQASLSLAEAKIQKLAQMIEELADHHAASVARLRKLAGRLRFTQTAVAGRFGRAALRPIYDLISICGGKLSQEFTTRLRRRVRVLPTITPRLILSYEEPETPEPFRIYSDATGEGNLASITFLPRSNPDLPILLKGATDGELHALAASTNPLYI